MPYRILIVEDHPIMREAYVTALSEEPDFQVCGAVESAEAALDALDGIVCDLVVTDFRLPGMDGAALVARLHASRPTLPTLVISGHEEAAFARKARRAGATGFLRKRDLAHDFIPTLRLLLEGGNGSAAERNADAA